MTSIRSSSGVSSTSSLLHCISDLEATVEFGEGGTQQHGPKPDVRIAVSEPEPEPSGGGTTDLIDLREDYNQTHQSSPTSGTVPSPPPPPSLTRRLVEAQNIHISAVPPSPSPRQRAEQQQQNENSHDPSASNNKGGVLLMKDFILTDSSIQAS
jgi:hypothetical protein